MRRQGMWLSRGWAALGILSILLAGCGTASAGQPRVAPAASATAGGLHVPDIQTISLDHFMVNYVTPTAHGLLLLGTPGTVGQAAGSVGYSVLYYYDDASRQIAPVATPTPATDGTPRGVQYVAAWGDWVAYKVADSDSSHWELWALNLATHAQQLVDSAAAEGILFNSVAPVLDGTNLVWSATSLINGVQQNHLRVYSLATGTTRTLLELPASTFAFPVAISNGTLAYVSDDGNGNRATWLWTLSKSAPTRIATEAGLNVTMNDRYVIWDDAHGMTLTLYDRATKQQTEGWVDSCIRPVLGASRPYVVCVDFDTNTYRLAQVPGGAALTFFDHQSVNNVIGVSGDRAYWVGPGQGGYWSNQIDYFDLPGQ